MFEIRTSQEAFEKCQVQGQIVPRAEINVDEIKALLELSEGDKEAGNKLMKGLDKSSILWNNVFTSFYDALHKLVDAYLRFDKITSLNHICLFAYLCEKHSELELDWAFFEKVRTKRNGVEYYGQKTIREDFVSIEVQMSLYISTLKKAIDKKLREG